MLPDERVSMGFGGSRWVSSGRRCPKNRAPVEGVATHSPLAQLDRASDYGSEGREFESLWAHLNQVPKIRHALATVVLLLIAGGCARSRVQPPVAVPAAQEAVFLGYADLRWEPIIPELGSKSPE